MDNSVVQPTQTTVAPVSSLEQTQQDQVNLLDVDVKDENVALNVMVTFLNAAQRRGAFSMPESAKIWECVKVFQRANPPTTTPTV
jgi:hypothetical protein